MKTEQIVRFLDDFRRLYGHKHQPKTPNLDAFGRKVELNHQSTNSIGNTDLNSAT